MTFCVLIADKVYIEEAIETSLTRSRRIIESALSHCCVILKREHENRVREQTRQLELLMKRFLAENATLLFRVSLFYFANHVAHAFTFCFKQIFFTIQINLIISFHCTTQKHAPYDIYFYCIN